MIDNCSYYPDYTERLQLQVQPEGLGQVAQQPVTSFCCADDGSRELMLSHPSRSDSYQQE